MTTVPSTTAPSTTSSILWNNKNYLLSGLGIVVLVIAYLYLNRRTSVDNRPPADLSQRSIKAQFPHCANVKSVFPNEVQGIIRISLEDLGLAQSRNPLEFIFIEYTQNGKTFSLPMTVREGEAEAYLRHLPLGIKIHLQFKYQNRLLSQQIMPVDQTFGIYQLYFEDRHWKVTSHSETPPQAMGRLNCDFNADDALSLSINNSSKLETVPSRYTTQESYYIFENTTQKVHVLFFEIAGLSAYGNTNEQRLVVPIAVFPGKLTTLPQGFLRTSWEQTFRAPHGREPPSNPRLTIASILDTAAH